MGAGNKGQTGPPMTLRQAVGAIPIAWAMALGFGLFRGLDLAPATILAGVGALAGFSAWVAYRGAGAGPMATSWGCSSPC